MPELPEVETVARGLAAVLDGHRIEKLELHRPDLRFPFPDGLAAHVEGHKVVRVARRAKYLLIELDDGGVMLGHLGMSGRMMIGPSGALPRQLHDHVVITTDNGVAIRFNDPRRFGFLDYRPAGQIAEHPMLASLGPEPLSGDFTGAVLAKKLAKKATSLKAALLDQTVVAGLGNIYVCESMFGARLSPRRLALTVTGARASRLVASIKEVLNRAIAAGGSSLRDYVQTSGELGYFQHQWAVYGRAGERCPGCICGFEPGAMPGMTGSAGGIKRIVQSNRSTFYCPRRQR